MKIYELRLESEATGDAAAAPKVIKVYLLTSLMFIRAAAAKRGVQMAHTETNGEFTIALTGDRCEVAGVVNDFDTRPL